MLNLSRFVLLILVLCTTRVVHAQNIGEALAALKTKDYVTAFSIFKPLAENNDVKAQEQLGWLYWAGQGVAKDEQLAVTWFRKAAEQGSASAQYGLGMAYAGGKGVVKDEQQAMLWYEKAAEKGHAKSQVSLAELKSKTAGNPKQESEPKIQTPEPSVPTDCAAFSGDWFGIWQANGAKFWFKVYEVDKECKVKYSYAKDSSPKKNTRSGVINNGVLVMELSGGARDEISVNGNELLFKFFSPTGNASADFKKVQNVAPSLMVEEKLVKLGPEVPQECAAFWGKWEGNWSQGGVGLVKMSVLSVDADCQAVVQYSGSGAEKVEIKSGELKWICNKATNGTCAMTYKAGDLWANYTNPMGGTNNAVFKKVQ